MICRGRLIFSAPSRSISYRQYARFFVFTQARSPGERACVKTNAFAELLEGRGRG
jgi:hypothetical protein